MAGRSSLSLGAIRVAAAIAALICAAPTGGVAQCAVCGNPAFAVGDNDVGRLLELSRPAQPIQSDVTGRAAEFWSLRVAAHQTMLQFLDLGTGAEVLAPDAKGDYLFTPEWALRVHVTTLAVDVQTPIGTGLSLIVPFAVAAATRYPEDDVGTTKDRDGNPLGTSYDSGISDLELRVRQRVPGLVGLLGHNAPALIVSLGAVAPTGAFIPKDSSGVPPDGYVSLGRGVWWALADLEVVGPFLGRFGYVASVSGRQPLTTIDHKGFLFHWGTELRSQVAIVVRALEDRVTFSIGARHQYRGQGMERIFEDLPLEPFPNGGGTFVSVQPALAARLGANLTLSVAARIPIVRSVNGVQPIPGLGLTAGLAWATEQMAP